MPLAGAARGWCLTRRWGAGPLGGACCAGSGRRCPTTCSRGLTSAPGRTLARPWCGGAMRAGEADRRLLGRFAACRRGYWHAAAGRASAWSAPGQAGWSCPTSMDQRLRRDLARQDTTPPASPSPWSGLCRGAAGFPAAFRARIGAVLGERGMEVSGRRARALRAGRARQLGLAATISWRWTRCSGPPRPRRCLARRYRAGAATGRGFVRVGPTLESVSHLGVFAAGDTRRWTVRTCPDPASMPCRGGPAGGESSPRDHLAGRSWVPAPRRRLYLISGPASGTPSAPATAWSRGRLGLAAGRTGSTAGSCAGITSCPRWPQARPPVLPTRGVADAAAIKEISAIAMRCGGCGAKVGATVLAACARPASAVRPARGCRDRPRRRPTTPRSSTGRAAAGHAAYGGLLPRPYRRSLDVRARSPPSTALGRHLRDGGEPQAALAIVTLPFGLEPKVEGRSCRMLMAGANTVLRRGRLRPGRRPYQRRRRTRARLRGDSGWSIARPCSAKAACARRAR